MEWRREGGRGTGGGSCAYLNLEEICSVAVAPVANIQQPETGRERERETSTESHQHDT